MWGYDTTDKFSFNIAIDAKNLALNLTFCEPEILKACNYTEKGYEEQIEVNFGFIQDIVFNSFPPEMFD